MAQKGVSGNFVVIFDKNKPNAPGKKALIPPKIAALKKNATRLLNFDESKPVRALYNQAGDLINSVSDIEPGSKIYASYLVPEQFMESISNTIPMTEEASPPASGRNSRSFAAPTGPQGRSPSQINNSGLRQPSGRVSAIQQVPGQGPQSLSSLGQTGGGPASLNRSPSPNSRSPSAMFNMAPSSRSPSSLMIVVNQDGANSSMLNSSLRKKRNQFEDDGEEQFVEEDDDEKRLNETGISYRALQSLMSILPESLVGTIPDVADHILPVVARFATNVQKLQSIQEANLINRMTASLKEIPGHSQVLDQIASDIVNNATFGTASGQVSRYKTAIVGPSRGGKSTFLKIVNHAALARYLATGQYKRTLCIYLDILDIAKDMTDPFGFYNAILKVVFKQVGAQRFEFEPFSDLVIQYFQKLPQLDRFAPLPTKFSLADEFRVAAIQLNEIAKNLYECVHTIGSLSIWYTNVVMLPRFIANAFGFKNVHFAIDHIDKSDIDIAPEAPFDTDTTLVTLIEHLKLMLDNDSFIISCVDETRLLEALDLITDDGVDLRDGTEIISIIDSDNEHSEQFEFSLTIDDEQTPVKLKLADCGGCSGYLAQWDAIISQAQLLTLEESKDKNSRYARQIRLQLLSKIRELVPYVLLKVNPEKLTTSPLTGIVREFEMIEKKDLNEESTE